MVQVGMNERTKKNTLQTRKCSRKNPVYQNQNQIGFPIDKPKEQHKRAALPPQN
jgi:hypothetical protein